MSSALRSFITQGGESSAAARALLIIGASTSGLDMTDVREELPDLMSYRLRPEVREQLLVLIAHKQIQTSAPLMRPLHADLDVDDELLLGDVDGAGFDV